MKLDNNMTAQISMSDVMSPLFSFSPSRSLFRKIYAFQVQSKISMRKNPSKCSDLFGEYVLSFKRKLQNASVQLEHLVYQLTSIPFCLIQSEFVSNWTPFTWEIFVCIHHGTLSKRSMFDQLTI